MILNPNLNPKLIQHDSYLKPTQHDFVLILNPNSNPYMLSVLPGFFVGSS